MENYTINELISWRLIDGQILILDSHLNESAHELNEVGSYIFSSISEGKKTSDIRDELIAHYPKGPSLEEDIQSFLNKLKELQLIIPSN